MHFDTVFGRNSGIVHELAGIHGFSGRQVWFLWANRSEASPRSSAARWNMDQEGVVHDGVIVPDDAAKLPEGMRVRISPLPPGTPAPFGERFARFKGAIPELPVDLAAQHEHFRLGTPKR